MPAEKTRANGRGLGRAIALQDPGATLLQGDVVITDSDTGALGVNVGGLVPPVRWTAGTVPVVGDKVRLLAYNGELVVLPRLATPRPSSGTVTAYAAGAATCTVLCGGTTFDCHYNAAYTPTVGDLVRLDWSEPEPFVLCKRSVTAASPAKVDGPVTPEPPPGPADAGVTTFPAIDSGYFSTSFGWSGSTSWGSRLMQGSSGGTNTGAWFYGTAPAQLAGRTLTGARIRVIRAGSYGDGGPSPAHLRAHGSTTRPAGNVALGAVAGDATLPRGGADWFPIALDAAAAVVAGGGLAISGAPYLVLEGIRERSDSGLLELAWTR